MKKQFKLLALIFSVGLIVAGFTQCSKADVSSTTSFPKTSVADQMDLLAEAEASDAETNDITTCIYTCINGMPIQELSETEINALNFIREEEFLAHDIYVALYAAYNIPVFNNISKSENIHTTAIRVLMEKYALADPAADHVNGVFTNPDIQALYDALLAQGMLSINDAIVVGATIEDYDIADLVAHIDEGIDNEDILFVLQKLYKGSRNHLRAFYAHLQFRNISYTPQFISLELYNEIVTSDWEFGNGFCSCEQTATGSAVNIQTR
ncbi:MAG: DUF2202 domain-containing protein [Bacteroidales bacterium]